MTSVYGATFRISVSVNLDQETKYASTFPKHISCNERPFVFKVKHHLNMSLITRIHTHTHTHTYIYIYICLCVCECMYVCVCVANEMHKGSHACGQKF